MALTDSLGEYLDGLPQEVQQASIDQLLHHTSGITDYTALLLDDGLALEDAATQDDALEAIGRTELDFDPGSRFQYSNSNYVLLASIVEVVTGEPFAAVVDREAIGDADLIVDPASTASDVALGYQGGAREVTGWLQVGDGSVVGTPAELALWADIYRDENDTAVQAMTVDGVREGTEGYGAGIRVAADGSLSHGGRWGGFVTLFEVSTDRSTAIVVTCNSPDLSINTIHVGLLEVWFDGPQVRVD